MTEAISVRRVITKGNHHRWSRRTVLKCDENKKRLQVNSKLLGPARTGKKNEVWVQSDSGETPSKHPHLGKTETVR